MPVDAACTIGCQNFFCRQPEMHQKTGVSFRRRKRPCVFKLMFFLNRTGQKITAGMSIDPCRKKLQAGDLMEAECRWGQAHDKIDFDFVS